GGRWDRRFDALFRWLFVHKRAARRNAPDAGRQKITGCRWSTQSGICVTRETGPERGLQSAATSNGRRAVERLQIVECSGVATDCSPRSGSKNCDCQGRSFGCLLATNTALDESAEN